MERKTYLRGETTDQVKHRTRGPNYTAEEKLRLLNLVGDKKEIIESKKTDGVTIRDKKHAWEEVEILFNSIGSTQRSTNQLKSLYESIKHDTKKNYLHERKELYMTGKI